MPKHTEIYITSLQQNTLNVFSSGFISNDIPNVVSKYNHYSTMINTSMKNL